jgi:metallo-beta-lactamase class B
VKRIYFASAAIVTLTACGPRELQPDAPFECDQCDAWNEPQEPFRVHGNTWFVGTGGLSSILIESDDGLILIDGGLPQSAALIDANIRSLGFDPLSIKAILLSHPHFDHAGGRQAPLFSVAASFRKMILSMSPMQNTVHSRGSVMSQW